MKILSTEEAPLRVLRAAGDAHFRSNGSFEPLLRASAIAALRISAGASQRSHESHARVWIISSQSLALEQSR